MKRRVAITGVGAVTPPDELARRLPVGRFLNLARTGASSHEVVEEQLAPAVRAGPDLISLVCGANDVIPTTRPDLGAFAAAPDELLATLRDGLPRATIVTATYPDVSAHSPLRPVRAGASPTGCGQ